MVENVIRTIKRDKKRDNNIAINYYAHSLPGRPAGPHGQTFENRCREHCEREGVAPRALLVEGATQAPVIAWQLLEDHLKNVAEIIHV